MMTALAVHVWASLGYVAWHVKHDLWSTCQCLCRTQAPQLGLTRSLIAPSLTGLICSHQDYICP
jgi:hypothetical protein